MSQVRILEKLARHIRLSIARGIITLVKDAAGIQIVQVALLDGEVRSDVERFQDYGFTSVPVPGAESVVLFPGGSRAVGYVVAADDRRYRKEPLLEGEVAVYHLDGESWVHIKNGGQVEIKAGVAVSIESPTINLTATTLLNIAAPTIALVGATAVTIAGPLVDIQAKGDYKAHKHTGVQAGGSQTGGVA